ncbi:MAG: DUF4340 domain-containing protein [Prochloraceae cyanobacterium]|nr:DUF4340 domain-containing protein [Prochloraceae cyanobacterium]
MKLQRTTWFLLGLALFLGGFVYVYEIQGKPQREAIEAKQKQIFTFPEKEIKELTIERAEQTLKFERTQDDRKPWLMKQPEEVSVNDGVISFLLNLLAKEQSDRSFTVSSDRVSQYGLDKPLATITILLENGKKHQLILGKPDFQDKFIYALTEPQTNNKQKLEVILVSKNFQYAIEREIEEWKQKEENTQPSNIEGNR